MISSTGWEGGSLVMGLSPGECNRCAGPGSCEGAGPGALACAGLALGDDVIGPGESCATTGSAKKRAAARKASGWGLIVLMALENFKAILQTLFLLIQYRILAGQKGLHRGNLSWRKRV